MIFGTFPLWATTNESVEKVLEELDAVIADKQLYHSEKEKGLAALKLRLKNVTNRNEQFGLYRQLANEYLHYQADSSLYYIDVSIQLLSSLNDPVLNAQVLISRAEVLGVMGMYSEALEQLKKVSSDTLDLKTLTYYYRVYCACYGWLADYTAHKGLKEKYRFQSNVYRDSILSVLRHDLDKDIVQAERYLSKGEVNKSISMLNDLLNK